MHIIDPMKYGYARVSTVDAVKAKSGGCSRGDHSQESRIPIPKRHMGRYHDIARAVYAHRLWRAGGVRKRPNPGAHWRRPSASRYGGQKMGQPFKLTGYQNRGAIKRRNQGDTLADIGCSYNVSPATISRLTA